MEDKLRAREAHRRARLPRAPAALCLLGALDVSAFRFLDCRCAGGGPVTAADNLHAGMRRWRGPLLSGNSQCPSTRTWRTACPGASCRRSALSRRVLHAAPALGCRSVLLLLLLAGALQEGCCAGNQQL